jgi:hypothetical protein
MACRYYDDILTIKLHKWLPDNSNLRVLGPSETKRLFELSAEDRNDAPLQLPLIALNRHKDIELLSTTKSPKSYDGIKLLSTPEGTLQFNVIPIKLMYDLLIYTKTEEEVDEYVRNFLFKLINNPVIKVKIPYNGAELEHIANIRVLNNISDTSDISERIFTGQFHCWTIQLEIQDAFLFSLPYRRNWQLYVADDMEFVQIGETTEIIKPAIGPEYLRIGSCLELSNEISLKGEKEALPVYFKKN